jgi:hypothetical protein
MATNPQARIALLESEEEGAGHIAYMSEFPFSHTIEADLALLSGIYLLNTQHFNREIRLNYAGDSAGVIGTGMMVFFSFAPHVIPFNWEKNKKCGSFKT